MPLRIHNASAHASAKLDALTRRAGPGPLQRIIPARRRHCRTRGPSPPHRSATPRAGPARQCRTVRTCARRTPGQGPCEQVPMPGQGACPRVRGSRAPTPDPRSSLGRHHRIVRARAPGAGRWHAPASRRSRPRPGRARGRQRGLRVRALRLQLVASLSCARRVAGFCTYLHPILLPILHSPARRVEHRHAAEPGPAPGPVCRPPPQQPKLRERAAMSTAQLRAGRRRRAGAPGARQRRPHARRPHCAAALPAARRPLRRPLWPRAPRPARPPSPCAHGGGAGCLALWKQLVCRMMLQECLRPSACCSIKSRDDAAGGARRPGAFCPGAEVWAGPGTAILAHSASNTLPALSQTSPRLELAHQIFSRE